MRILGTNLILCYLVIGQNIRLDKMEKLILQAYEINVNI